MAEKLCRDARAWCILLVLTCSSMGGVSLAFSVTSPMRGAGILIIPGLGAFRRAPPLNSRGGGVVFSRPEIRGGGRSSRHVAVLAGAQLDDLSVLAAQSSPPKEADEAFEKSVELYKKLQKEGGASAVGAVAMMLEAMRSLDKALDLDWQWFVARLSSPPPVGKVVTNVTCMRPKDRDKKIDAQLMDQELLALDLEEGRVCDGGHCCEGCCSRVSIPLLASAAECEAFMSLSNSLLPPLLDEKAARPLLKQQQNLPIQLTAAAGKLEAHLLYIRLIERLRRAVSREWGIPLGRLSPRQTFVSRLQGSMDVSEYSQLHCDECSTSSYHYSAVLYLSQRASFTGGDFVFTDPPREAGGKRELTRVRPEQGQAVMFSSGWENYHFVDSLSSGVRFAVPTFFTTLAPVDLGEDMPRPFEEGDETGRARMLYEHGLLPSKLNDFLNFKQRWGEFFGQAQL